MQRRSFLQVSGLGGAAGFASATPLAKGAAPSLQITRLRFYLNPRSGPTFNQSFHIVKQ